MGEGYPHGDGEVRSPAAGGGEIPLIAVDTGGTFTDLLLLRGGVVTALKVHSTPDDPARAILEGIGALLRGDGVGLGGAMAGRDDAAGGGDQGGAIADRAGVSPGWEDGSPPRASAIAERVAGTPPFHLIHGSTVATNTLLERKGARVFLITNAGFEDVFEIGRQNRPQLYALVGHRPPPLVPATDRIGIAGRIDYAGAEFVPLEPEEIAGLPGRVAEAEAVAVVLLHSYANPSHEEEIGRALTGLGIPVSLSSRILPEFREYERTATTVVNAYVAPRMATYLGRLERSSGAGRVRVMGSSGGALSLARAMAEPVHTILSGPAGGVVGALEWGRRCGIENLLSFDMGGTSTDVSLLPGRLLHTSEGKVGDLPLAIPLLDIHTVGAGGGSIARIDRGGALRVGPESAGAMPGPIAYGRGGTEVTVTDANLWLGRLLPAGLLDGGAALDRNAVEGPMAALAGETGGTPDDIAEGIIEVVNTAMEGALRVISIERGVEPGDFHLLAFGGAGALHAAELADRIGLRGVLIPPEPGLLSAFGMLVSPMARDRARTVFLSSVNGGRSGGGGVGGVADSKGSREATFEEEGAAGGSIDSDLDRILRDLGNDLLDEMSEDGVEMELVALTRWVDARYEDQSFELRVPAEEWVEGFHRAHEERFGYRRAGVPVVAVTARVRGEVAGRAIPAAAAAAQRHPGPSRTTETLPETTSLRWRGKWIDARLRRRSELQTNERVAGPALIVEYSSTILCPPGWEARVDPSGVLAMNRIEG